MGTKEYGTLTARTVKRMEPSKQLDKERMLSMIGVPWDKRMGKSVRRLVPEGLPWQPPASAPVATDAEEAAGQP
eukprot:6559563-Heterocapsa_arctica.AAC.1